jgi:uncharacterized MnhB-related membrane protein
MLLSILFSGAVICAILAIQARRLLSSALWLAGVSGLMALGFYLIGAHEIAVIELSVGAGLVTVLFVFAIAIAGDEAMSAPKLLPRPVIWAIVALFVALLGWVSLSWGEGTSPAASGSFSETLWEERALDVLVQAALIFGGTLAVLGILAKELTVRTGRGRSLQVTTIRPISQSAVLFKGPRREEPAEQAEEVVA